jgi:hypothetical protein
VGGLLRAPYTAMYTSFMLTLHTTLHTPPYAPKHFYEALVQTRFIRYKELSYVDLRALTMASLVLGFTSYPSVSPLTVFPLAGLGLGVGSLASPTPHGPRSSPTPWGSHVWGCSSIIIAPARAVLTQPHHRYYVVSTETYKSNGDSGKHGYLHLLSNL